MNIVKASYNQLPAVSPVSQAALERLMPEHRLIISAALQPKIKELPALDVVTEFTSIITAIYTVAGQQPETKALALYADEFYSKLMETYPAVSIEEVRAALRSGVYGEYGDFFGLNPKTFIQFVRAYLNTEQRKEARAEYESKRLEICYSTELPQAEKEEQNKDFVNLLYKDFLNSKLLTDYIPAHLFDFLEQQKTVHLTNNEKKAIKERAKAYYLRLQHSPKMAEIGEITPTYLRGTDTKLMTRIISKQFAVFDFFERCKLEGKQTIY